MPSSDEILSQMTLRSVKGSPLSNDEMDKNLMLIADAYPSVQDQLDMIYHEGLDAWREKIKAIKDEFPKGTTY